VFGPDYQPLCRTAPCPGSRKPAAVPSGGARVPLGHPF
jgi:hypothetical protein